MLNSSQNKPVRNQIFISERKVLVAYRELEIPMDTVSIYLQKRYELGGSRLVQPQRPCSWLYAANNRR